MRWLALVMMVGALGACAEVKPWQRGPLTHHSMDPNDKATQLAGEFNAHVFDVREGCKPGGGFAGGGCGCN